MSENFARLLANENWESTGGVQVKGKGQMQTYLWVPRDERQLTDSELGSAKSGGQRRLSRNGSATFSIAHSRQTVRSLSSRRQPHGTPECDSDSNEDGAGGGAGNDPLLAILANIRQGDGHEGEANARGMQMLLGSASTAASKRPKSARWLKESRRSAQGEGHLLGSGSKHGDESERVSEQQHDSGSKHGSGSKPGSGSKHDSGSKHEEHQQPH